MSGDARYLLDANVFIDAARRYYAFDLVPAFWKSLTKHAAAGLIRSIDRVKKELDLGKDELSDWARDEFHGGFDNTDDSAIVDQYITVVRWVSDQDQFMKAAKSDFASGADGWIVATAIVRELVVVTQEILRPDVRIRVPIPNVCEQFGVKYINTFEMLRALGIRLT